MASGAFEKLFKFTCVRNPWERVISFYFSPHRGKIHWDRQLFIEFLTNVPPVSTHIALGEDDSGTGYFKNIDYFIRFENLDNDFRRACALIGIPWTPLPVRNKSTKQHFTKYYDDELVDLARNRYRAEIDHFGYEYSLNSS